MKKIYFTLLFLISIFAHAQVGYGTPEPDKSAAIEILATDKGILIPRVTLTSATQKLQSNIDNANALLIFNNGTTLPQGFYYWKGKIENGIDNGRWFSIGSTSTPSFFYLPSVVLPTNATSTIYVSYNSVNQTYTVDLYGIFKSQFDAPLKSSNAVNANLSDLVLGRNAYEYHIIYADSNVFPTADIVFSTAANEEGKFTYKVTTNAIVRNSSFMNIVLKVKN